METKRVTITGRNGTFIGTWEEWVKIPPTGGMKKQRQMIVQEILASLFRKWMSFDLAVKEFETSTVFSDLEDYSHRVTEAACYLQGIGWDAKEARTSWR